MENEKMSGLIFSGQTCTGKWPGKGEERRGFYVKIVLTLPNTTLNPVWERRGADGRKTFGPAAR